MIPQQLQLLITFVILLPQVLILLLQFSQLIGHPFLYPRGFRLDLPRVLESQLPLQARDKRSSIAALSRPIVLSPLNLVATRAISPRGFREIALPVPRPVSLASRCKRSGHPRSYHSAYRKSTAANAVENQRRMCSSSIHPSLAAPPSSVPATRATRTFSDQVRPSPSFVAITLLRPITVTDHPLSTRFRSSRSSTSSSPLARYLCYIAASIRLHAEPSERCTFQRKTATRWIRPVRKASRDRATLPAWPKKHVRDGETRAAWDRASKQ